jgi:hypothetical protein
MTHPSDNSAYRRDTGCMSKEFSSVHIDLEKKANN